MSIKLTALDLEFWRRTLKGHYGNAADEIDFIIDAALSQTAPSAQEGAMKLKLEELADFLGNEGYFRRAEDVNEFLGQDKFGIERFMRQSATPSASALGEALESVTNAMSTWPGDWGNDSRHAWIYGVLVGWDEALDEVAKQHGWDTGTVERLCRMRSAVAALASPQPSTPSAEVVKDLVDALEGLAHPSMGMLKGTGETYIGWGSTERSAGERVDAAQAALSRAREAGR